MAEKPEMQSESDEKMTETCSECGEEFKSNNGQYMSDFQFHQLTGCEK